MKILLVDDNDRFRQFVVATLEGALTEIDIIEATSPRIAKMIFESDPYFQVIISSLDLKKGTFLEIFSHFQEKEYTVPFITYSDQDIDESIPGVPLLYKDEENDLLTFKEKLFSAEPLRQALPSPEAIAHQEYIRIRLFFLWRFSQFEFPVFIKLSEEKYVKVLNPGQKFGPDFIEKYQQKTNGYLYVKKEDFPTFSQSLYQKPLYQEDPSLSEAEKSLRKNQFIQNMAQTVGITPDLVETSAESIQSIIKEAKNKKTLAKLLHILEHSGSYNSDHATLLSYITAALCDEMGWNTRRSKEKLGFASLFHDITLIDPRLAVLNYRSVIGLKQFDKGIQQKFKEHPLKAGDLVKEITAQYPQVDTIITQHHERPDGTGFPYGKDYNQITPLSSLFIVAHDFVSRAYEKNFDLSHPQEILDAMEPEYQLGHFAKCMEALRRIVTGQLKERA